MCETFEVIQNSGGVNSFLYTTPLLFLVGGYKPPTP